MATTRKFSPPNLPISPPQYSSLWQEQFSNVLRLFFNTLTTTIDSAIPYGSYYDTTTQSNPVASATNLVELNSTTAQYQVSIVSLTKIYVTQTGVYNLEFSAQLQRNAGASATDVYFWLLQNGKAVNASAGYDSLPGGSGTKLITGWSYITPLNAKDYIQIAWASADTNISIQYLAPSGSIPASPSMGFNINWVSNT